MKISIGLLSHFWLAITRKYPLCGYILGMLTHTTAWDQHWGGLKHWSEFWNQQVGFALPNIVIYRSWLCLASGLQCRGLGVTQNANFSLLTHTKKLLLVKFCDRTAETGVTFRTHGRNHGRTHGWTDRHDGWNSYLDSNKFLSFSV